jgi:hypothetical protein
VHGTILLHADEFCRRRSGRIFSNGALNTGGEGVKFAKDVNVADVPAGAALRRFEGKTCVSKSQYRRSQ